MSEERELSRSKKIVFTVIVIGFSMFLALVIAELAARLLKPETQPHSEKLQSTPHAKLGWLPEQGKVTEKTHEYTAHFDVNAYGMNDEPIDTAAGLPKHRILGVGDSHTFAVGINQQDTWPNVLEKLIYGTHSDTGEVYNAGVIGYNLGQYLVRSRLLEPIVDPQITIIGFSMATDLYDLVPPEHGGFIYGGGLGRVYFDLDSDSNLVEKHDLVGGYLYASKEAMEKDQADTTKSSKPTKFKAAEKAYSSRFRDFLSRFELYKLLRRSKIAMWIATNLRPGGESLWPGLDTSLKKNLTESDAYRWKLAEEILKQFKKESKQRRSKLVLVNIPYLAQVYSEVWESSFGSSPETYDRWIGNKRLQNICTKLGIIYIDTTAEFIQRYKETGRWLHYKDDGHPTKEGQQLIAETIARELKQPLLAE